MTRSKKIFFNESRWTPLLLVGLLYLHVVSCKNECENYKPAEVNYNISQGFLNLVPYNGFDTLSFIRGGVDTIKFYGTGRDRSVTVEDGDLGGCGPTAIIYNENFRYKFNSSGPFGSIVISLSFPDYFYCYFRNKVFKIPMGSLYAPYNLAEMDVNGTVYYDINFIPREPIDTLYYDNEVGMIKFGFQNGEQWTLVKK